MNVTIAGGGTGGHISPAIAVAEAIWEKDPDTRVDFIATPRPVDARMYGEYGDMVHVLDPPRIDRGFLDLLLLLPRSLRALLRSRRLLRTIGTSVLFATGGYSSFFPVLAARSMGIPVIIHDSNSVPGRANRIAARFSKKVLVGFRKAESYFPRGAEYTGNPVRSSMVRRDAESARKELGIPPDGPLVLFLGGSQGARAMNDYALKVPEGINLLLQCGDRDLDRITSISSGAERIHAFGFSDDPALLYSAADLAVARSGAMTVAEMTWFRVPAVYVPYPFAADDHQRFNALEISRQDGALIISQDSLEEEDLWGEIENLLEDRGRMEKMRSSLAAIMPENPSRLIAEIVASMALKGSDE